MLQFSDSTYRIFIKIISFSAILQSRIGVGGLWGRAGGQGTIFFDALTKSWESRSISLVCGSFLINTHKLIKYSLFFYFQTNTLMQNPSHTFHPCLPQVMSDIFCGRGMLRRKVRFLGRACSAQEQMVTSLDDQCAQPALPYP